MQLARIFDEIHNRLKGKKLFAVFDRDGTLVPIVEDPSSSLIPDALQNLLSELSAHTRVTTAILSARGMTELVKDFPNGRHILAGNYGLEINVPGADVYNHPIAQSSRGLLEEAKESLRQSMIPEYKTILEDHGLSLCLHWHQSPQVHRQKIFDFVEQLATQLADLQFKKLPTSYEVWPHLVWDKANGLGQILELTASSHDDFLFLYCGDSAPDEPAFEWVNKHGGVSIKVGKEHESKAMFRLESPAVVHELIALLKNLADEKQSSQVNLTKSRLPGA